MMWLKQTLHDGAYNRADTMKPIVNTILERNLSE